jgi:hypothetical protein
MKQEYKENILIAVIAIVLMYGAYRIYGYYNLCTAPFRPYTEDEARAVLAEIGSGSCEAFVARYIDAPATNDFATFVRGLAYDKGLCVQQDLDKAVQYYETSVIWYHPILSPVLRLALIYDYGPRRLRNRSRGDFLFRQAAVAFAPFTNDQIRRNYISRSSNSNFMPAPLRRELAWLDKHMMRNGTENRHIALELSEQGYKGTTGLWAELTPRNQEINMEIERRRYELQQQAAQRQSIHEASPENYTPPHPQRAPAQPIPGIDNSSGN